MVNVRPITVRLIHVYHMLTTISIEGTSVKYFSQPILTIHASLDKILKLNLLFI